MVLLCFSPFLHAASSFDCYTDTLIIDGITIGVEIEESTDDSEFIEPTDSIFTQDPPKENNPKLGIRYSYGFGKAEVLNETASVPIDQFIGNSKVPQSMNSITLFSELLRKERNSLQIGFSHTTWNQKLTFVQSEVRDSTWSFYSPADGSLHQITRVITQLGVEYDSLEMQLSVEKWSQRYFELPITYLVDAIRSKNNFCVSFGLSLIPGISYTSHQGRTHFVEERELEYFNSSIESKNLFNLCAELESRVSKQLSDQFEFHINVGYRKNFSKLFSPESPIELARSVVFGSVGVNYSF